MPLLLRTAKTRRAVLATHRESILSQGPYDWLRVRIEDRYAVCSLAKGCRKKSNLIARPTLCRSIQHRLEHAQGMHRVQRDVVDFSVETLSCHVSLLGGVYVSPLNGNTGLHAVFLRTFRDHLKREIQPLWGSTFHLLVLEMQKKMGSKRKRMFIIRQFFFTTSFFIFKEEKKIRCWN